MVQRKTQGQRRWTRWYPKKKDDNVIGLWADACSRAHNDCAGCTLKSDCEDLADRLISCMSVPLTIGVSTRVHPVRSSPDGWNTEEWALKGSTGADQRRTRECRTVS
jgi:hypothetical protein